MTEKLVATIEQRRSGARLVKFDGVLDEDNGLGELCDKLGAGIALINLSGVERINSIGSRDWMSWLATIEAKGTRPVLIACSPAVVEQLNRNKRFAGNAAVKSFQVPYLCVMCDREQLLLVHVADMLEPPYEAPACACDGCGGPMRFIDETGDYFSFLSELPPPRPSEQKIEAPDLARGSSSYVTTEHVSRVSQPRLPSRGSRQSLSAFQFQDVVVQTEPSAMIPRVMPGNERPYLIAIVALLLCACGVLVYLLVL